MASFEKSIAKIEKNESYSDKVYRLLKQLIISGQIGPGTVINERSFSNILDVSRTPLRDALKILESEGWIEQRGSQRVVAPLRWKDLCDLMEIREKLELMCFELAVPRTTEHDITYLQAILGSMKEQNRTDPSDLYAVMKADTEFHRYIAYISGNRLLLELQNLIYEKIIRSSVLPWTTCAEERKVSTDGRRSLIWCVFPSSAHRRAHHHVHGYRDAGGAVHRRIRAGGPPAHDHEGHLELHAPRDPLLRPCRKPHELRRHHDQDL